MWGDSLRNLYVYPIGGGIAAEQGKKENTDVSHQCNKQLEEISNLVPQFGLKFGKFFSAE